MSTTMGKPATLPEMVKRRDVPLDPSCAEEDHYAAAVTVAERLAKALRREVLAREAEGVAPLASCALLDELWPNWRDEA